jgi:Uma2 family endonuclease
MSKVFNQSGMSEAEYLALERHSDVKHEYAGGQIFAMGGASKTHNRISLNATFALRQKSTGCRVSMADVKLKAERVYYYPDVMLSCEPSADEYTETEPCVVMEVLSESTSRIDRGEKLYNYQKIPSLQAYVFLSSAN